MLDRDHVPPLINPISMVLIDDEAQTAGGVLTLVRGQPGFVVLATATGADGALRLVRERRPDVVLVHRCRPDGDHLALAGALHGEVPDSRTIVMGFEAGVADVSSFIRARVSGFVMAEATLVTFLATVRAVARGEQVLPPELAATLFAQLTRWETPEARAPGPLGHALTEREQEVCDFMVHGLSTKAIATRLRIRSATVRGHVRRILGKLSVDGRLEVATLSRGAGPRRPVGPPPPGRAGALSFLALARQADLIGAVSRGS